MNFVKTNGSGFLSAIFCCVLLLTGGYPLPVCAQSDGGGGDGTVVTDYGDYFDGAVPDDAAEFESEEPVEQESAIQDNSGQYDDFGRRPSDSSDLFLYDELLDPSWPQVVVNDPDGEPTAGDEYPDVRDLVDDTAAPLAVAPLPAFAEPGGEPVQAPDPLGEFGSVGEPVPSADPGPRVAPHIRRALDAARRAAPPPRELSTFRPPPGSDEAAAAAAMQGEALPSHLEDTLDDLDSDFLKPDTGSAPTFEEW